jgi:hypothetical protein
MDSLDRVLTAAEEWIDSFRPPWSMGEVVEMRNGTMVETDKRHRTPSKKASDNLASAIMAWKLERSEQALSPTETMP